MVVTYALNLLRWELVTWDVTDHFLPLDSSRVDWAGGADPLAADRYAV